MRRWGNFPSGASSSHKQHVRLANARKFFLSVHILVHLHPSALFGGCCVWQMWNIWHSGGEHAHKLCGEDPCLTGKREHACAKLRLAHSNVCREQADETWEWGRASRAQPTTTWSQTRFRENPRWTDYISQPNLQHIYSRINPVLVSSPVDPGSSRDSSVPLQLLPAHTCWATWIVAFNVTWRNKCAL